MKIILTQTENHFEVSIRNSVGVNLHIYVFDTKEEVEAFMLGWKCCQLTSLNLIQSLPQNIG